MIREQETTLCKLIFKVSLIGNAKKGDKLVLKAN